MGNRVWLWPLEKNMRVFFSIFSSLSLFLTLMGTDFSGFVFIHTRFFSSGMKRLGMA